MRLGLLRRHGRLHLSRLLGHQQLLRRRHTADAGTVLLLLLLLLLLLVVVVVVGVRVCGQADQSGRAVRDLVRDRRPTFS